MKKNALITCVNNTFSIILKPYAFVFNELTFRLRDQVVGEESKCSSHCHVGFLRYRVIQNCFLIVLGFLDLLCKLLVYKKKNPYK